MGGLITRLFLNTYKDKEFYKNIKKIITIGIPWMGSMEAYKTLAYGKAIPKWSKGLILREEDSKKISPSFPSLYQLLPNNKYFQEVERTEKISVLVESTKTFSDWETFFDDKVKSHFTINKLKYTEIINDFRQLLENPIDIEHHEIISFGTETITGLFENEREDIQAHFRNGDGTVPLFSAASDASTKYFVKDVEHDKLADNITVLDIIKNLLSDLPIEKTEKVYLDYKEVLDLGFEANILKIACPVMISILDEEGKSIYGYSDSMGEEPLIGFEKEHINIHSIGNTIYIAMKPDDNGVVDDDIGKIVIEAYDKGPTLNLIRKV